jgi:hypothetical protein
LNMNKIENQAQSTVKAFNESLKNTDMSHAKIAWTSNENDNVLIYDRDNPAIHRDFFDLCQLNSIDKKTIEIPTVDNKIFNRTVYIFPDGSELSVGITLSDNQQSRMELLLAEAEKSSKELDASYDEMIEFMQDYAGVSRHEVIEYLNLKAISEDEPFFDYSEDESGLQTMVSDLSKKFPLVGSKLTIYVKKNNYSKHPIFNTMFKFFENIGLGLACQGHPDGEGGVSGYHYDLFCNTNETIKKIIRDWGEEHYMGGDSMPLGDEEDLIRKCFYYANIILEERPD